MQLLAMVMARWGLPVPVPPIRTALRCRVQKPYRCSWLGGRYDVERYGMGSSHDWAAKGVVLLGIRAVLEFTSERSHRSSRLRDVTHRKIALPVDGSRPPTTAPSRRSLEAPAPISSPRPRSAGI